MILLPAIDLMGGLVVRLVQGQAGEPTVYSDDPIATAKRWASLGAAWLHVVDLDGAFTGTYRNLDLMEHIIHAVACPVEVSGGIRTEAALARAFEIGASRVVLGTKAVEDPPFVERAVKEHGDRIAVAIDMHAGQVVTSGWTKTTTVSAVGLARTAVASGVATLIATDTARDGTLTGPNLPMVKELLSHVKASVIASGGIGSLKDLLVLKALEPQGLTGAIIGKALYEGTIELREAIAECRS